MGAIAEGARSRLAAATQRDRSPGELDLPTVLVKEAKRPSYEIGTVSVRRDRGFRHGVVSGRSRRREGANERTPTRSASGRGPHRSIADYDVGDASSSEGGSGCGSSGGVSGGGVSVTATSLVDGPVVLFRLPAEGPSRRTGAPALPWTGAYLREAHGRSVSSRPRCSPDRDSKRGPNVHAALSRIARAEGRVGLDASGQGIG
jgi:hypothetical protein